VQRGGERPWRDWVDLPGGPRGAAGAQLERIFDAHVTPTPARYAWAPGVQFAASGQTVTLSIQPGLGLAVELPVETLADVESADNANAAVVSDLWSLGFLVARL